MISVLRERLPYLPTKGEDVLPLAALIESFGRTRIANLVMHNNLAAYGWSVSAGIPVNKSIFGYGLIRIAFIL